MELKAFGKINLSIDVLGKREDGYHDVRMIMQSIALFDTLSFKPKKEGIYIRSSNPFLPCDERNIVHKALKLLKSKYGIRHGMEVYIDKKIPVAAGLAGGSADGAAAIIAANAMWNLNLSYEDMVDVSRRLGADVAFCLKGGTALAEGIGEILTPLPPLGDFFIVLAKPPVYVSTKDVYSNLKLDKIQKRPHTDELIDALSRGDARFVAENMVNVLETVTAAKYPAIEEIKSIMLECKALGSIMSGSGPTVFGIFEDRENCFKCCSRLRRLIKEVFITKTVGGREWLMQ